MSVKDGELKSACILRWSVGLLFLLLAPVALAAPRVAVVDCEPAAAWLRSAGVESVPLTSAALGQAPVPDVQVVVLPLDRLHSDAALRSLSAFTARGGKVIAVYWGTLARPEQQADYPVYRAAASLGIRVIGWAVTGPAVARLDPQRPVTGRAPGTDSPQMRANDIRPARPSVPPAGSIPTELRVDRLMLVRVEPEPSAQVLGWLIPDAPQGGAASGGGPDVLALRNGNMFYVAANLFHRGTDSPELRRLFFWVLDQAVPQIAASQARERAGAAIAAVIRAQERLKGTPEPPPEAIRRLLEEAQEAAMRAKTLAASDQFVESAAAADRARELTERAVRMMETAPRKE